MKRSGRRCHFLLSLLGAAVLAGCLGKTPAAVYYTLSPIEGTAEGHTSAPARELAVGIGPVKFSDELDRPAIVTRSGSNRLAVNAFRRWGAPWRRMSPA